MNIRHFYLLLLCVVTLGCNDSACRTGIKIIRNYYGKGVIVGKYIDHNDRGNPKLILSSGDTLHLTYYYHVYKLLDVGDYVFKDSSSIEVFIENEKGESSYFPICGGKEYRSE